ncbi:MAG: transposase [Lysobacter sp.]|nr:MAG: transposase [Lysobacter sp.]
MYRPPPASGYRALRKGRVSVPHHAYLVTAVVAEREPRFQHRTTAEAAAGALTQNALWTSSRLLCWVLMPDHLHALVQLGAGEPLHALVRRMKCNTAAAANRADGRTGAVWTTGYHDRAIRGEHQLQSAARYIIANPLRAGLVESISEYPYWGDIWFDRRSLDL